MSGEYEYAPDYRVHTEQEPPVIRFEQPPPCVGWWEVGGHHGMRIMLCERPRWLTRVFLKAVCQWKWVDQPQ